MNRKTTTGYIKGAYALFAFCLVFNHFYLITNGLKNETHAGSIKPTAVSVNYNLNIIVALVVILSFFYILKRVKYSTRSIR